MMGMKVRRTRTTTGKGAKAKARRRSRTKEVTRRRMKMKLQLRQQQQCGRSAFVGTPRQRWNPGRMKNIMTWYWTVAARLGRLGAVAAAGGVGVGVAGAGDVDEDEDEVPERQVLLRLDQLDPEYQWHHRSMLLLQQLARRRLRGHCQQHLLGPREEDEDVGGAVVGGGGVGAVAVVVGDGDGDGVVGAAGEEEEEEGRRLAVTFPLRTSGLWRRCHAPQAPTRARRASDPAMHLQLCSKAWVRSCLLCMITAAPRALLVAPGTREPPPWRKPSAGGPVLPAWSANRRCSALTSSARGELLLRSPRCCRQWPRQLDGSKRTQPSCQKLPVCLLLTDSMPRSSPTSRGKA